ncbi:MFS transporter [Chloroflexi bacterium TSY]|nr:MFS transporter [Chloroflexi bacterium TSY]
MLGIDQTHLRNLTILLGSTTTVLAATIIAPALPEMASVFQAVPNADFLVRLTLTMPTLFIAIGAPFVGILLDRLGRKPVLIAALILYGLAGTAGFFLNSLTAILVSRALLGLAVAGIMSGFTTLIIDYFSGPKLDKFMGYQAAFIGLGGMVFLLIAGFLADIGWRFPFLVLPGVLLTITEPQAQTDSVQEGRSIEKSVFPIKALAPIYIASFLGVGIFFLFPVQLPFYLITESGVSSSQVGLALSLQTLASVISALLYQRLKTRLSFAAIFALIFLAFSINHFMVSFTSNYGAVIVALLIGGLGIGLFPPNANIWLASVTPPALRGRAVGGMSSAFNLGAFFSPILAQPLIQLVGSAGMFGVAGSVSLLIVVVFIGIAMRSAAEPAAQNA